MVRTDTDIRRIVHNFVSALEPNVTVDRVILYGSYARDEPHEWSDIDLAIISPDFARLRRPLRQALLGRALTGNTNMIEALGYSVAEYNNAERQTFLGEIKRTGKVIYTRRKRKPRPSATNGQRAVKTRPRARKASR